MTRTPRRLLTALLFASAAVIGARGEMPAFGGGSAESATERQAVEDPDLRLETVASAQARFEKAGVPVGPLQVQRKEGELTIFRFDVLATDAAAEWKRLRAKVELTGYYPVICSDPEGTLLEIATMNEMSATATLAKATTVDGIAWLQKRAASDPLYYGALKIGRPEDPAELRRYRGRTDADLVNGWSKLESAFTPMTYDSKPVEGVWIALVPTKRPFEVPAYFRLGDWNGCPPAWVHVAVLREWHERYGTEIVAVSGDTIELRSSRPVKTLKAATQFALEQFHYSGGDSVFQGSGTLMGLIEGQIGSPYTFIWWD